MFLKSPEALAPYPCLFLCTIRLSQQLLHQCGHDFLELSVVPWDDQRGLQWSSQVLACAALIFNLFINAAQARSLVLVFEGSLRPPVH
jgi:hypothetical protein